MNGAWTGWDIEALNLPPTVRDVVGSRIERLSPAAREVANVAAIVGARLTFDQLSALSRLDSNALAEALSELCAQRVLEEIPLTGDTAYDFAHPILQQVTYAAVGSARARLLPAGRSTAAPSAAGRAISISAGTGSTSPG